MAGDILREHLNTALRIREIELTGVLTGHKLKARPMTGYERGILLDRTRVGRMIDGILNAYVGMIQEWTLTGEDGRTLPITEEVMQRFSPAALDSLQDALDPLVAEMDVEANAFFEGASGTSAKDTPTTP